MNIWQRFIKSFESKTENAMIVKSDAESVAKAMEKIERVRMNVPWQIIEAWQHGNQTTIPIRKVCGDALLTTYECGCKFEEKINDTGFSGHWCNEHARRGTYQD